MLYIWRTIMPTDVGIHPLKLLRTERVIKRGERISAEFDIKNWFFLMTSPPLRTPTHVPGGGEPGLLTLISRICNRAIIHVTPYVYSSLSFFLCCPLIGKLRTSPL
jgi:hypothetical protein